MSYHYVCPRCRKKWPIRLEEGAVCPECQAEMTWERLQKRRLVVEPQDGTPPTGSTVTVPSWLNAWVVPVTASACNGAATILIVLDFTGRNEASPWYIKGDLNVLLLAAALLGLFAFVLGVAGLKAFWEPTVPRERTIQTAYGINAVLGATLATIAVVNYILFVAGVPLPLKTPMDLVSLPQHKTQPLTVLVASATTSDTMTGFKTQANAPLRIHDHLTKQMGTGVSFRLWTTFACGVFRQITNQCGILSGSIPKCRLSPYQEARPPSIA